MTEEKRINFYASYEHAEDVVKFPAFISRMSYKSGKMDESERLGREWGKMQINDCMIHFYGMHEITDLKLDIKRVLENIYRKLILGQNAEEDVKQMIDCICEI